jgi:NAD(P)-dependent dehydrogenase (short-subunit alcohol dehydrogenase family)
MEPFSLESRTIIVTGASRGIGGGIIESALRAGAQVLGVARHRPSGWRDDPRRFFLELDITDDGAADQMVDAAVARFGAVHGLVNNAGLHLSASCWEQSDEEFDRMFAVNVTAPFLLSSAVCRYWIAERQAGSIVNVGSVECDLGWNPPPQVGYAATKGAMLGLTRVMALEMAAHGIRVNAVGPGAANTEMTTPFRAQIEARIPLGHRFAEVDEIGDVTVFLLADAARYVTGEILYVDGGYRLT